MKITETCIDCLISRVRLECLLTHASPSRTEATVRECSKLLEEIRSSPFTHPQIASRIHRNAYELLGDPDPFADLKRRGNRQAAEVCREVRPGLATFRDHVLASVIGNTFDYGVKGHRVEDDFFRFFKREFSRGLAVDHTDAIASLCSRVVYLCDNAGEIVLDRLLIEYLKGRGAHVTVAVREAPILNDATLEDAVDLGIDRIADLLTTTGGGAEIGISMGDIPDDLAEAISCCSIIVSKGMANFESLSELGDLPPVAYLLAAKCRPVADELGVPTGSKVAILRV